MSNNYESIVLNSGHRIIELIDKLFVDKVILASKSERRKEILSDIGLKYEIFVSSLGETNIIGKEYNDDLVKNCAKQKAENAYKAYKNLNKNNSKILFISADTVVVNNGIIIGKPKDRDDAKKILKSLSSQKHSVITAICILYGDKYYADVEKSYVVFKKLKDLDIDEYIDKFKPYDKAGSYGIQDEGFNFVDYIDGNIDNVIGFPLILFEKMLNTITLSSLEK